MVGHDYFPILIRKSMTTIGKPAAAETQSCAEDIHGGPSDDVVAKAAPKSRTRKMAEAPTPIDDPLFFAKLHVMSKKITQDARRCRLASLPIV